MFISFLYMFRVTMCPSSGETTVFMRHLVLILCGWLSGMQGEMKLVRQSSVQNNEYQVLHKYSYFSWWWAHSHPKHVEKRNELTKKNCAPSWLYLQDYTRMHSQHNIKFINHYIAMNIVMYLHYCNCKFCNTFIVSEFTNNNKLVWHVTP